MKKIIKYIMLFAITVILSLGFLVVTAKIPKEMIAENVKKSAQYFHTKTEIEGVSKSKEYTYRDMYADSIILNIAYCIDEREPLSSVLESKYYLENKGRNQQQY